MPGSNLSSSQKSLADKKVKVAGPSNQHCLSSYTTQPYKWIWTKNKNDVLDAPTFVHLRLPVSTFVDLRPPVSTYVQLRLPMSTCIHMRPLLSTCVHQHPMHLVINVAFWQLFPIFANVLKNSKTFCIFWQIIFSFGTFKQSIAIVLKFWQCFANIWQIYASFDCL